MPSDARVQASLDALRGPIAMYRSIAARARERARALLASGGGEERARLELGRFGARIDAARFAELSRGTALDGTSRSRLRRAAGVLDDIIAAPDDIFVSEVAPGDSLPVVVSHGLALLGRVFGASAVVELVRAGRYEAERHDGILESYAFASWNRSERANAPPLIVRLDGADVHAGALADLLDGTVRIVLVVRGATTPAPLVGLVCPGTLVLQTNETAALSRIAGYHGPAIAALVEQDAAIFTHDPAAGRALWQRLTIDRRPAAEPTKTLGGLSPRQQREELAQLEALVERPALPASPVEALVPTGSGDPADRLTAWLLAESGLSAGAQEPAC
jgi:hypothetical protein